MAIEVWVATAPIYLENVRAYNINYIVPASVVTRFDLEAQGLVVKRTVPDEAAPVNGVNPATQAELDAALAGITPAAIGALSQAAGDARYAQRTNLRPAAARAAAAGVELESVADPATWDVITGAGTLTTAAGPPVSLELTSPTGALYAVRRKMGHRLPKGGAIVVRLKRDANLSVLDFSVRTTSYSAAKVYSLNLSVTPVPVGEWYDFAVPLAAALTLPGSPAASDANEIIGVEIKVTPTAGTVTVLNVASVKVVGGDPRPGVCFVFDDGRADTYTNAFPILSVAGFVGNIAVEYTAVGAADRMTQAQLNEVYADGWSMLGHHTQQMTPLSTADQTTHHEGAKHYLLSQGWTRGVDHWVWPGGARNIASDKIARRYWRSRRGTASMLTIASAGNFEPYDPSVFYVTSGSTLTNTKTQIDKVVRHGGVVVFVFHSLVTSTIAAEDWLTSDFQALVDYCVVQGVACLDYDEVFSSLAPGSLLND